MPLNVSHTTDLKAAWYLSIEVVGVKLRHISAICALAQKTHSLLLLLMISVVNVARRETGRSDIITQCVTL
jgi:hypothetical protein